MTAYGVNVVTNIADTNVNNLNIIYFVIVADNITLTDSANRVNNENNYIFSLILVLLSSPILKLYMIYHIGLNNPFHQTYDITITGAISHTKYYNIFFNYIKKNIQYFF